LIGITDECHQFVIFLKALASIMIVNPDRSSPPAGGQSMNAISEAASLIQHDPVSETARIISSLILALESGSDFAMSMLYALDVDDFHVALALIPAWRRQHLRAQKDALLRLPSVAAQKKFVPQPIQVRGQPVEMPPGRLLIGASDIRWAVVGAH
jgi:hypothetical protein